MLKNCIDFNASLQKDTHHYDPCNQAIKTVNRDDSFFNRKNSSQLCCGVVYFTNNVPQWSSSTESTIQIHVATLAALIGPDEESQKMATEQIKRSDWLVNKYHFPSVIILGGSLVGGSIKGYIQTLKQLAGLTKHTFFIFNNAFKSNWQLADIRTAINKFAPLSECSVILEKGNYKII